MGFLSKGFKNEFETPVVNEPSVFEPLKVYCSRLSSAESVHGKNKICIAVPVR